MKSLAIVGTGIAGMACAYKLQRRFDLTVYEKNDYAGGHTNTVFALEDGRGIPIDTGFMVYNEVTYPELTRLFAELGVRTQSTSMSFSVQYKPLGLEFCGSGLNGLFAQRRNLLRPSFWKLLLEIDRFNRMAPQLLEDPQASQLSLGDFARQLSFSQAFLDQYLIPMSSAVWSTPPDAMLRFPAITLIRFFKNHGFLGLHTQHPWRTVTGGSRSYRDLIVSDYRERIHLSRPAKRIERQEGKALVTDASGQTQAYDHVVLACHADEALALLADPTPEERAQLSPFKYQRNRATLHTDDSVMPETRSAWSSWNYRVTEVSQLTSWPVNPSTAPTASTVPTASAGPTGLTRSIIYWMNSLQGVSSKVNYFVSIDDPGDIDERKILQRIDYDHPLFTLEAIAAQAQLPQLNDSGVTFFCGSYFRYGFHEDALLSALDVVRRLA